MASNKYWDERALRRLSDAEKETEEYIKRIKKIYARANRNIKKQIANIYKNYSKETGIDIHTLKTLLSKKETDKFWKTLEGKGLKKYVQDNYKARINRLEQLQGQLYAVAKEVYKEETSIVYGHYAGVINQSYNKTIYDTQIGLGYDFAFNVLDLKTVEALLNEKWHGGNYSERIWNNTDILADKTSEILGGALISGQSMSKTILEIQKAFNVSEYFAKRLVRTETNHFNAEAEALAYEELGVKRYVFVATLDNRTSEKCQNHDGKVYNFKDKKTGINYPPLHPNCRSTTRGYIGETDEKRLKRRAKNPITGEVEYINNMNYEKWRSYIDNKYGQGTLAMENKKQTNLKRDKAQYEKYIRAFGKEKTPETFEKWQEMKYNNNSEYSMLKNYYVASRRNELPADMTYDIYKDNLTTDNWKAVGFNPKYVEKHKKHLKEFGDITWEEYEDKAKKLLNSEENNIERFISDEGTHFAYNKITNEFALARNNGITQTYYLPKEKEKYWREQIEKYGKKS